jgi:methylmalonic aciduria homocystinuria type C protein
MELLDKEYQEIVSKLDSEGSRFGLEIIPFKTEWYNNAITDEKFAFDDAPNTLAFIVISTPSMFEKAFLPYIKREASNSECLDIKDPLDRCMKNTLLHLSKIFRDDYGIVQMHDFEISPITKRPKVLVQTAGHVAGAVRLYQNCNNVPDKESQVACKEFQCGSVNGTKVFPVCLHPKYGGWFALRGVLIFKNVRVGNSYLKQKNPPLILTSQNDIENLLYSYNHHWKDWKYRDIGMPRDIERYSDFQKKYFETEPSVRHSLIEQITKGTRV